MDRDDSPEGSRRGEHREDAYVVGIQQIDGKSNGFVLLDLDGIPAGHVFHFWENIGQKFGRIQVQETEEVSGLGIKGSAPNGEIGSGGIHSFLELSIAVGSANRISIRVLMTRNVNHGGDGT
jgi:hypothetical protein